jgi:hypothetical protein
MDYDLMLRMCDLVPAGGFLRTRRPLGCFRVYPGQKTGWNEERTAVEHRMIADRRGTAWKYGWRGQLLRLFFRGTRVAEYLGRGRADFLWSRVLTRFARTAAD